MSLLFSWNAAGVGYYFGNGFVFLSESAVVHELWVGVEKGGKKTPGYDFICFTHQALLQMGELCP